MTNIVLFDMDDTLSSENGLGDHNRVLFFPDSTKKVFADLQKRGDQIIICSKYATKLEIESALTKAKIDYANIIILGEHKKPKVETANEYKNHKKAKNIIIVEDSTSIDDSEHDVVHIQVPYKTDHTAPPSDAYLKVALLPEEQLFAIKPIVKKIKQNQDHHGQINSKALSNYYEAIVKLMEYRDKRQNDYREFYTNWACWFGGEARSKTAKLKAVDSILDSLNDGTFDIKNIPEAAKNGELASIVNSMKVAEIAKTALSSVQI
ncbi:HAD family hydrolase [Fluoribacter gormanii]|uniref:HAD family hydrolase n=1 Tax=Fluoribacter gormanii TaxID=464 RepID=UPI0010415D55|nr:HAD family hydrolase [Fluoribacter gormanii]